jgi:hypothetical protein
VGDTNSAARYPFPPGRPAHFFVGVAIGLGPWAVVWFLPTGAAVLSVVAVLGALGLLSQRAGRSYGCGLLIAVLFDVLALALLAITGLRPG